MYFFEFIDVIILRDQHHIDTHQIMLYIYIVLLLPWTVSRRNITWFSSYYSSFNCVSSDI